MMISLAKVFHLAAKNLKFKFIFGLLYHAITTLLSNDFYMNMRTKR